MICIGIESTAHTFGIGIVDGTTILADSKHTYIPKKGAGIIPTNAAKHHKIVSENVLREALCKANVSIKDIELVAFAHGPGMPPCLKIGMELAKEIAMHSCKLLVSVNHCVAHLEIARIMSKFHNPLFIYVSGANTQIIMKKGNKYRIFGETQDIGLGNAIDKVAREIGLSFPYGPELEKIARNGKWIDMPYTVKGMDLSFSGIVSDAIRKFRNGKRIEDICFSFQEVCFSMLTEVVERAMAHLNVKELVLTGGVAANSRLSEMLYIMCKERGAKFFCIDKKYAGDNGAMIALTGFLNNEIAHKRYNEFDIKPVERIDEFEIKY